MAVKASITIELSPVWSALETLLPDAPQYMLDEVLQDTGETFGSMIVEELQLRLRPHLLTGQLSESLGYSLMPRRTVASTLRGDIPWISVGLYRRAKAAPAEQGRSPLIYMHLLEEGSSPHQRAWGRESAARVIFWAKERGIPALPGVEGVEGYSDTYLYRHILGGIFRRGTRAFPFIEPTFKWAVGFLPNVAAAVLDSFILRWRILFGGER